MRIEWPAGAGREVLALKGRMRQLMTNSRHLRSGRYFEMLIPCILDYERKETKCTIIQKG